MALQDVLDEFGVRVLGTSEPVTGPCQTFARGCLHRIYADRGEDVLRGLLRVLCETHPASRWAVAGHILDGVLDVLDALGRPVDGDLLDAFDAIDLAAIDRKARALRPVAGKRAGVALLVSEALGAFRPPCDRIDEAEALAGRTEAWKATAGLAGYAGTAAAAEALGEPVAAVLDAVAVAALDAESKELARAIGLARSRPALRAAARHPTAEDQAAALRAYAAGLKTRTAPPRGAQTWMAA